MSMETTPNEAFNRLFDGYVKWGVKVYGKGFEGYERFVINSIFMIIFLIVAIPSFVAILEPLCF